MSVWRGTGGPTRTPTGMRVHEVGATGAAEYIHYGSEPI